MRPAWTVLIAGAAFAAGYLTNGANMDQPVDPGLQRQYREPAPQPDPAVAPLISEPDVASPAAFKDLFSQPDIFSTLHMAFELAAEADIDTLRELTTEALRYKDPLLSFAIADIFVERMNAIDINSALDFAESLPAGRQRYQLLTSIHNTWRRKDPEAAAAYAQSVTDPTLQRMLATATASDQAGGDIAISSMGIMASSAGSGAVYGMQNEQVAAIRQRMISLQAELRQDPEGTIEALLSEPDGIERQALLPPAMAQLARRDPELALAFLELYPDELRETEGSILSTVASQNPQAVAGMAEDFARRTGNTGPLQSMLGSLMQSDVNLALAEYESIPDRFKPQIAMNLGMQYVQRDPEAGLRWMLEQPSSAAYVQVALQMGGGAAQSTAESMLFELPEGETRDNLLNAVASARSQRDGAAAAAWLEQYQGESGYEAAMQSTLSQWASQDPLAAATYLDSNPQLADPTLAVNIVHNWAYREPESAIAWVAEQSDPELQTMASAALVSALGARDPARAEAVYEDMPESPSKHRAGAELAMQLARGDRSVAREKMAELGVPEDYIENYMTIIYR